MEDVPCRKWMENWMPLIWSRLHPPRVLNKPRKYFQLQACASKQWLGQQDSFEKIGCLFDIENFSIKLNDSAQLIKWLLSKPVFLHSQWMSNKCVVRARSQHSFLKVKHVKPQIPRFTTVWLFVLLLGTPAQIVEMYAWMLGPNGLKHSTIGRLMAYKFIVGPWNLGPKQLKSP